MKPRNLIMFHHLLQKFGIRTTFIRLSKFYKNRKNQNSLELAAQDVTNKRENYEYFKESCIKVSVRKGTLYKDTVLTR